MFQANPKHTTESRQ